MSAKNSLKGIFKKLKAGVDQSVTQQQMIRLGNEAVKLIVKRTRLGYGVKENLGQRFNLSSIPWTDRYKNLRRVATLDGSTSARKSNLTFTGQMLRSVTAANPKSGGVTIKVSGDRTDTDATNEEIANVNAKRGRVFNRLSLNEYNQLVRIYRQQFTGLLKKLALIK